MTDEPDLEGRTSLMWAAGKGAEDVIQSIVKHNPDINAIDKTGATGEKECCLIYGPCGDHQISNSYF